MVFTVLLVLPVLAGLAAWRRRPWLACGFGGAALLLLWAVGCGPVPRWLLARLQQPRAATSQPSWAARNAIVLLGGGTELPEAGGAPQPSILAYGRIVKAAELYRDCKAAGRQCLLLVSGGDSQHHQVAEAVVYGAVLRRLGIPVQDLMLEPRSRSTWQNAQFSRPLLQAYAPQRVFLVTSGFHLRRSLLYFAHFGIHPVPVSGGELRARMSSWPLSWNVAVCDVALHEYAGMVRYHEYDMMGWNVPPLPALIPPQSAPSLPAWGSPSPASAL